MKYIQHLEKLTAYIDGDKENSELDVAIFYSDTNQCECQDPNGTPCVTYHGFYFGTGDEREPKFCPTHYFSNLGYKVTTK